MLLGVMSVYSFGSAYVTKDNEASNRIVLSATNRMIRIVSQLTILPD